MDFLVWPFVGLLVFVSLLVLANFRGDVRGGGARESKMRQRREWERRRNREFWRQAAGEAARLRAEAGRLRKPFAEPEITSGEITFGAAGGGGAARGRAASAE